MTLELLICTLDEGINRLERSLLPQREDVRYLVSWQYTVEAPDTPQFLQEREDVRVVKLQGRGLCRNRNHALQYAQGDILKICDDDETWTMEDFDTIRSAFEDNPHADIIYFQIRGISKCYPSTYVSSCEIALRRTNLGDLRFDERFGLGSEHLCAGEEEVLLYDARQRGLHVVYSPQSVCEIHGTTTGDNISDPRLQRSKGAVFYYTRGCAYAYYKCIRESIGWMLRKRMNPIPILHNMLWGIKYISQCKH